MDIEVLKRHVRSVRTEQLNVSNIIVDIGSEGCSEALQNLKLARDRLYEANKLLVLELYNKGGIII